jgi:hypothetical protein
VDARGEIVALAGRIENQGDLRFCARATKVHIYLWAARLHSQIKDKMGVAREYRAKALSIDAAADTEIIDVWLSANSGDVASALARLRNIDTPDGRSNLFAMLSLHHGRQRALDWLDANSLNDTNLLTAVGWKNAATLLAEAGRWEDAARLVALPDEMIVDCPDIPYVEGVINAALKLLLWVRRSALTMQIFERQVETLQGAEVAARHQHALHCFDHAKKSLGDVEEKIRAAGAETWRTGCCSPSHPAGKRENAL